MNAANVAVSDPSNAAHVANSSDWRTAVTDLLTAWIAAGRCFSSGEVAATLRAHRPDLRFSTTTLGDHVRNLFYRDMLPTYPPVNDGNGVAVDVPVLMASRITAGLYPDRTPANTLVFVYGPSAGACAAHEFEVFIPNLAAGETMDSAPPVATPAKKTPAPAARTGPSGKGPIIIDGNRVPVGDIEALVWTDDRLCIPRSAFEVAVHLAGTSIKGGDPVFVKCTANEAVITLEDTVGSTRYDLWTLVGRIAFRNLVKPFVPGTRYKLDITAGKITVKF